MVDHLTQTHNASSPRSSEQESTPQGDIAALHGTVMKCMGRTYQVTVPDTATAVTIIDVTDITHPTLLGTALPDSTGTWQVSTARCLGSTRARDLLHAAALLHEAARPRPQ
ncbi:hypothetical protein OG455_32115 [Kitasatospora sp. NBC_01287]|uniref:hypothetical protein n=1 Tax=Kitasatospora sp. NBC_01287 TaxID=2903573 RepID=UPI0022538866|nr:hypothetical protein [Kitasatospora sp. NBC_01287]MCX4750108.1 hypothetical protein [Kitasatospora sp. NBC_01287]